MTQEKEILQVVGLHPMATKGEIASLMADTPSDSTIKRVPSGARWSGC